MRRTRGPKQVILQTLRRRKVEHWLDKHEREQEEHQAQLLARLDTEQRGRPIKKERARS